MLGLLRRITRRGEAPPPLPFGDRYEGFKELLNSNSELLSLIAEIEAKLGGDEVFGMAWVRSRASRLAFHGARLVHGLNRLSGGRYAALGTVLEDITRRIREVAESRRSESCTRLVIPYAEVGREMVDWVGGKNAHLGEMTSRLHLPVPPGFAITTSAYELFLEHSGLIPEIRRAVMALEPGDMDSLRRVSEEVQHAFLSAPVPEELERAIEDACADVALAMGAQNPFMAMRSSAIGEDGELSFAGQYLTVLNVPPHRVLDTYRRVLASLYTPRAISYRLHQGVSEGDMAMSVGCLAMVPARASGVAYSRDPRGGEGKNVLINAVWGLGAYAVDGRVPPDEYRVSRRDGLSLSVARPGNKNVELLSTADGRTEEHAVPPERARSLCLDHAQASAVARAVLELERHFGAPQDVEWAFDAVGRLFILQARPLRILEGARRGTKIPDGAQLILEGGDAACPGAGSGPVHHADSPEEAARLPLGAVLVVRHSSPKYVAALPRAAAVLAETGSVTGHMASLTREFNVPAVFNLPGAVKALAPGEIVTVDGDTGRVFRGAVALGQTPQAERRRGLDGTPVHRALTRLAELAVPLNLTDPSGPNFNPSGCRTLHDVMRFAHERCYREMFRLGDQASDRGGLARRLNAPLPLDLYVIDLGGGLTGEGPNLDPDEVRSTPFAALLRGMLHPALSSREPKPINLRGFMSVWSQQMLAPPQQAEDRFGKRSYALVSDCYLNFSSRVGYHYSVLDSWCGERMNENYLNFEFKGGAADDVRKNRRSRAIAGILEALGLRVEVTGDRVVARYRKYSGREVEERLDQLGRLLIYTRQMDMLMVDEAAVARAVDGFLSGTYDPAAR